MAVIKAARGSAAGKSLSSAIDYAAREQDKHEELKLTRGVNCSDDPDTSWEQMRFTKEQYGKTDGRQYKHYIMSFKPQETTPEQALDLAEKLVSDKLPGHESFLGCHIDKDHIHVHIVTNSVNFENGEKLHLHENFLEDLKSRSDEICKEAGLSVIDRSAAKRGQGVYNMSEYQLQQKGQAYSDKIGEGVMAALVESQGKGMKFFQEILQKQGISIVEERSKNDLSFRDETAKPSKTGKKRRTRASTLAEKTKNLAFTRENILAVVNDGQKIPKAQAESTKPLELAYIEGYKLLAAQGKDDKIIARRMLMAGFKKNDVVKAITQNAPKKITRSDLRREYAQKIVSHEERELRRYTVKTSSKAADTPAGNGSAGGSGGASARATQPQLQPDKCTAVALDARLREEYPEIDWSMLTAEQAEEKRKEIAIQQGL